MACGYPYGGGSLLTEVVLRVKGPALGFDLMQSVSQHLQAMCTGLHLSVFTSELIALLLFPNMKGEGKDARCCPQIISSGLSIANNSPGWVLAL